MVFTELSRPWSRRPQGTPTGAILLCHGFTGSPQSMRPWGEHLAAAGWDVRIPLLPGHARSPREMARTTWRQGLDAVREPARRLIAEHGRISVGGLSMGGALALALAEGPIGEHIDALALVNPAVVMPRRQSAAAMVLHPFVPTVAGVASDIALDGAHEEAYERVSVRSVEQLRRLQRRVRAHLDAVRCPVLLATSRIDHVVPARSSELVARGVSGPVTRLGLDRSLHVATLDHDAAELFAASAAFLAAQAAGREV